MLAYIAGPLYNEGERWFNEKIEKIVNNLGIHTFLPHRDLGVMSSKDESSVIFNGDLENLKNSDIIIANLNGITIDPGTAWEIGYSYAKNKKIIGIHSDERIHVKCSPVNLMVLNSLDEYITDINKLHTILNKYFGV